MKINLLFAPAALLLATGLGASASTVCPSTPNTTSDCDFLITIGSTGMASVMQVPGSTPFNSAITFTDGTSDPGGDASLVGVIDNYSKALTSLTLTGSGANAGIFDFSFNGICVYTNASYCSTAASVYQGPTTTFSNLHPTTNPFETSTGTVTFGPALGTGQSTYFSLEDSAADISANGGLTVTGETFAAPEPSEVALLGLGISLLAFGRRRWSGKRG